MEKGLEILSDITVFNKYAKYIPALERRETWDELVTRNKEMHIKKFPNLEKSINLAYQSVYDKKILPSMRSLQFGGKPIELNNARINNCSYLPIDHYKSFSETMFLLLSGCGVGYSVQFAHVNKLPPVIKNTRTKRYVIEDSIIGWAESIRVLIKAYLGHGAKPKFDFSDIRPKGANLITSGGKAPGAEPLKRCLFEIEQILENKENETKLTPIECHSILCHIADSVLSGGIRRCLPEGSKVHTRGGMINIENINIGDEVLTSNGYYKVKNKFEQGLQKLVRVTTQDSYFECTPNHKVAVLIGQDEYIWKRADELELYDRLIAPSQEIEGVVTKLPDFDYIRPKHSTTCKDIIIPDLDNEIAWFLGLIQGDGYVRVDSGKGNVSIACSNDLPQIIEKCHKLFKRFGINTSQITYDNYCVVKTESKQLATYFNSFLKQPSICLEVPSFIWSSKTDIKLSYVKGLMDADGSVKTRPVTVCVSVYKKYCEEIRLLLSSCGLQSRLKKLSTQGLKENWQEKYSVVLINTKSKLKLNEYGIKIATISDNEKFTNSYPKEFLDFSHPNNYPWSKTENKLIPVAVLNVEEINEEKPTWDIEVEEKHEFFCEGYLMHNSAMIAGFSFDDKDMISCKTGNWWETNPHFARANNSAVIVRNRCTKEEFDVLWERIEASGSGEPGILWTNNPDYGTNPCFTGDTNILTPSGYISIGGNVGELELINKDGEIVNGKIWSNGVKEVIELTLSNKTKIKCTPDHTFMLCDGTSCNAENSYKKRLMSFYSLNQEVNEFTKYGFIQGDGGLGRLDSTSHKGLEINIGVKDIDIFELFNITKEKNKSSYYVNGYNEILRSLQFDSSNLPNRQFPKTFDSWEFNDKMMFLKGMYSANGGVIIGHRISYKTTSKTLANQLVSNLMLCGIDSYITTNKEKTVKFSNGNYICKQSYDVNISKYTSILLFAQYIGFVHKYKQDSLRELINIKSPMVLSINYDLPEEEVFDFSLDDHTHWGVIEGVIAHNCGEISLRPFTFCNLCEINGDSIESKDDFLTRCSQAAFISTLQASYTDFVYLRSIWKENTEKDALIGVGITGIASNKIDESWLEEGATQVKITNINTSELLGINTAARCTTIKPAGTTSCVLGCSSGIHAWHNDYYIRRIRIGKNEALYTYLLINHPEILEDEFFKPTEQAVICLPIKAPDGAILRNEDTQNFLDRIYKYNKLWVKSGYRSGANQNNVSATVSIKNDEWKDVGKWMWDNKDIYSGISVLPYDGHTYKQAPFEDCTKETYESLMKVIHSIDLSKVIELDNNTNLSGELACAGGSCEIN